MKLKVFVLAVLANIAAVCVWLTASTAPPNGAAQQQRTELEAREKQGLTMRERARLARLRGQTKVFIPRSYSTVLPVDPGDADSAAAGYTVVVAEPVAMLGRVGSDDDVVTSYKFRIPEVLSEPTVGEPRGPFTGEFPQSFSRLARASSC